MCQGTVRTLSWQPLQSSHDCNGMFPGASPALPFLHFLAGCSQQVSSDFLKTEHIYSLGQASCDNFHLSYLSFIQIMTANCMGMHFLAVNKCFPLLLFNMKAHLTGHEKLEFLSMTVIHMLLASTTVGRGWLSCHKSETRQPQVPLGEAGNSSLAVCMEHGPCSYPGAEWGVHGSGTFKEILKGNSWCFKLPCVFLKSCMKHVKGKEIFVFEKKTKSR